MNLEEILQSIQSKGLFSEKPCFTSDHLAGAEKRLAFTFPESYVRVVTRLEPELANFYFVEPHRHSVLNHLIIFARWNEDQFAFTETGDQVSTVLQDGQSGKSWRDFEDWLLYVWSMSNRPVNPE